MTRGGFGWRWVLVVTAVCGLWVVSAIQFTSLPPHVDYLIEIEAAREGAAIEECSALAQSTQAAVDVCVVDSDSPACSPVRALGRKLKRCIEEHRPASRSSD